MPVKSKKVMVVDDELDTIDGVGYLLEIEGYKAIRASGGRQALQLLEKDRPDLVLLDLMMPDLSGWEVLRKIRDNPDLKNVPVILVSASHIPPKLKGNQTWQEFVPKPFDFKVLLSKIDRLLKNSDVKVA